MKSQKGDKKKYSHNRSHTKKQHTCNTSELSFLEECNYASVCSMFKNNEKKRARGKRIHDGTSPVLNSTVYSLRVNQQVYGKKKKPKKTKARKEQPYEKIPFKNSFSSEILFSVQDTKRMEDEDHGLPSKAYDSYNGGLRMEDYKQAAAQFHSSYDANIALRLNIKREFKHKVDAAIKIQKVFRGYLTRKILSKYVQDAEKNLENKLRQYRGLGQIMKTGTNQKSGLAAFTNWQQPAIQSQESEQQECEDSSEQSDEDDQFAYPHHHQPIYSKQQISKFLQQSEPGEQFDEKFFYQNIIFETNEEYIESRKSSYKHQKSTVNRLGKPKEGYSQSRLKEEQEYMPKHEYETIMEEQQSKRDYGQKMLQQEERVKQENRNGKAVCSTEAFQGQAKEDYKMQAQEYLPSNQPHQLQQEIILKTHSSKFQGDVEQEFAMTGEKTSKRQSLNQMRQDIPASHRSQFKAQQLSQAGLQRLREAEMKKWQNMISLVAEQLGKEPSNNQLRNFMGHLISVSQKNRQTLLNGDIGFQLFQERPDNEFSQSDFSRTQEICRNMYLEEGRCSDSKAEVKMAKRPNIKDSEDFEDVKLLSSLQNSEDLNNANTIPRLYEAKYENKRKTKKLFEKAQRKSFFMEEEREKEILKEGQKDMMKKGIFSDKLRERDVLGAETMRGYLADNVNNRQIEAILELREQLLEKRECEELMRLNCLMSRRELSQEQFILHLKSLTQKFMKEKEVIDCAKKDITRGYNAALSLIKEAMHDARKLGYKLPLSKSVQTFNFKQAPIFHQVVVDEIGEFNRKRQEALAPECAGNLRETYGSPRILTTHFTHQGKFEGKAEDDRTGWTDNNNGLHLSLPSRMQLSAEFGDQFLNNSSQSSEIEFTEQELNRFRKAKPYDMDIANMNKNMAIGTEFVLRQSGKTEQKQLLKQVYQIEEEQEAIHHQLSNKLHQQVVSFLVQKIVWESAGEFLLKPAFSDKLIRKRKFLKLDRVNEEQLILFVNILEKELPSQKETYQKLNQKVCPYPWQLLKCMRIDFEEEDEEDSEECEEVGRYQFIISQEICSEAYYKWKEQIEVINNNKQSQRESKDQLPAIAELAKKVGLAENVVRFVNNREYLLSKRKHQLKFLKEEVMKTECHCVFDSWNQEIVEIRTQKVGYSGIGLNELTLSTIDHNTKIKINEVQSVMQAAKQKVLTALETHPDMLMKCDVEQFIESNERWICYADQALSYALQFTYLIEEEIFSEIAKELRKLQGPVQHMNLAVQSVDLISRSALA